MPDSGRTPREIAALLRHVAEQIDKRWDWETEADALDLLADELEAGKWVRVPDSEETIDG